MSSEARPDTITDELVRAKHLRDAAPNMLATLDRVRSYLWCELCRDNRGGGELYHPASVLFREVEASIEAARFGSGGKL